MNSSGRVASRERLTQKYSWALPDAAVLQAIAEHSPIVEIGAGTGYWAYLLGRMGCEVHPYDAAPPATGRNPFGHRRAWCEVRRGTPETLLREPYRDGGWALLLCWPPPGDHMARKCLAHFRGDTLLYIGEPRGGHTASDAFFRKLFAEYEIVRDMPVKHWTGMRDGLWVCRRRAPSR